ncbi:MAG: hypothetical protein SFV51_12200 [Bryobacteraceae bacterium]|nr:hypothetical protein [Bryobacteraceae bacterium]
MICPHCGGEIELISPEPAPSRTQAHSGIAVPEAGHPWDRQWRDYDQALESLDQKLAEVDELNRLLGL